MSEINFNTYIDPNAIEEKSIEKTHLSQDIQKSLDNVASGITIVAINQEVDDANITNYITNPVFTQELNKKQNIISDLSTIRSNAEKATTAVQPNQVSSLAVTGIKMNGISKGTNGVVDLGTVITSLPAATTAVTGVVRLTSSTSSNAEDVAATPKAVTAVSTLANSAYNKIKNHLSAVTSDYTTGHTANQLYGQNSVASRSIKTEPKNYNHLLRFTGLMNNSTLGISNEGQYSSVVGVRAWNDDSGGPAHEFAFTENGRMYHRYGNESGDTSWVNWNKIVENSDLNSYVTTGTTQTISGVKKFTNGIEIGQGSSGSTSIISNQIDSGELKVWHSGTTKGFILRTNKKTNPNANIFPLELLTTNNQSSYQYIFPTQTGGTIVLNAKVNGTLYNPTSTGGTIDLGNDFVKTGNTQNISGVKNYTSNIGINSKSVISSQIDPGELKVCHSGTSKGFIIRTNTDDTSGNVYKLQLLTTDGQNTSYTYDFPKANGDIILFKNVTHSELLKLRNNSQLVPGGVYRITDYITSAGTYNASSAGHQFDIVVQALTKNELSEDAKACLHENDTYFTNTKIDAWEIKYCLDNNESRFAWTAQNFKGVIYYMKDEWGNEAPYDFKNIQFTKNGKKYYTFTYVNNDQIYDGTVATKYYYGNQILPSYDIGDNNMVLSHNIFINNFISNAENLCVSNIIGENCKHNVFGRNCKCNILNDYCTGNTFGDYCQFNEFEEFCIDNTLGDYCQSNIFGVNCSGNTFGDYILRCTFEDKCNNCKMATNAGGSSLLSYAKMITFGKECNNVILWTNVAGNASNFLQNYELKNNVTGTIQITGSNVRNRNYLTVITKNIYGDIEQFVLTDSRLKEITYSELKTLRDAGKLIPGNRYCITDYTATVKNSVSAISAGYIFNIIVEAVSPSVLSETAKARVAYDNNNSNSNIFKNNCANLDAWEIKYCLDNDDSRFDWADTTNGKGVIYYMKDEWGNEAPYDFKNIQFVIKVNDKDESFFTFNEVINGKPTNLSINNNASSYNIYGVYGNIIKPFKKNNKLSLNYIILKRNCNNNTFENNCYSNILGTGCTINTFGVDCSGNTFGNNCVSINFNEKCKDNNLGNNCSSVIFSNHCTGNTLGNNVLLTSFGSNCINNTLGNYYQSITFGTYCTENKIIKVDSNNEEVGVLEYVRYFTFGDAVQRNTFQTTVDTKSDEYLQMYKINSYIIGKTINLSAETQRSYTTTIARNSNGYIKQYCEGDLIL